jgi:hypothetical protein
MKQHWFFEKINNINKLLTKLTTKKDWKVSKLIKVGEENGDSTTILLKSRG